MSLKLFYIFKLKTKQKNLKKVSLGASWHLSKLGKQTISNEFNFHISDLVPN